METPWQIPFSKSICLNIALAIVAQFFVDRTLEALDALFNLVQTLTTLLIAAFALIPPLPSALVPVLFGTILLLFACAVVTAFLLCGHVVEFVIDDEGSLLMDVVDCPDPVPSSPPSPLPYPQGLWKPRRPQLPLITITPPPLSELELRDLRKRQAVEVKDRIRWKVELSWLRSNEYVLAEADPKAYLEAYKKLQDRASDATHLLPWTLWTLEDWTDRLHANILKDIQTKTDYTWAIAAIEKHRLVLEAQAAEGDRLEDEWKATLHLSELPQRSVEVAGEESSGPNYIDLSQIHQEESGDNQDITSTVHTFAVIPKELEVDAKVITEQPTPARLDGRAVETTIAAAPIHPTPSTISPSTPPQPAQSTPVTPLILVELVSSNQDHGTPTVSPDRPEQSHSDAAITSPFTDGPSTPLRSHPPSSTPIIPSPPCACAGRSHRGCGFATPLPGLSSSSDFEDQSDTSDVKRSSSVPTSPILEPKFCIHSDDITDELCDLLRGLSISPAQDLSLCSTVPQGSDCVLSNGTIDPTSLSDNSPVPRPPTSMSPSRDVLDVVAGPVSTAIAFDASADIFPLETALGLMPFVTPSEVVLDQRMEEDGQWDQINHAFASECCEPTAIDSVMVPQPINEPITMPSAPPSIFIGFQFGISIPPQNFVPVTSSWQYANEAMDAEPADFAARMVTDSGDDNNDGDQDFVSTDQTTQADAIVSMAIDFPDISSCPSHGLPVPMVLPEHLSSDSMDILHESSCHVEAPPVASSSAVDVQMAENPSGLPILVPTDPSLHSEQHIAMEIQITPSVPICDLAGPSSSLHFSSKSASVETPFEVEGEGASSSGEKAVVPTPVEHLDDENIPETASVPSAVSYHEEVPAKDRATRQLPQRRLRLVLTSPADPKDANESPDDKRPVDSNVQSGLPTVSTAPAVDLREVITPAPPSTSQAVDSVSALTTQNVPETTNLLRLRNKRGSLIAGRVPRGKASSKTQAKFAEPGELVYVEDEKKDTPKLTSSHPPFEATSLGTTTVAPATLVSLELMETTSPQVSAPVASPPLAPPIGALAIPTAWSQSIKSVNSRFLTRKETKPKVEDEDAELAEFLASRATAPKTSVAAIPTAKATFSKSRMSQASPVPIKSAEVKRMDTSRSPMQHARTIEAEVPASPVDTTSGTRRVRGLPTRAIRKSQMVQLSIPQTSTVAATVMSTSEIVTPPASSNISFAFAGGASKEASIPGPLVGDELEKTLTDAFEEIHHQDRTRERRLKRQEKPRTRR